jgi:hypothetical protein
MAKKVVVSPSMMKVETCCRLMELIVEAALCSDEGGDVCAGAEFLR